MMMTRKATAEEIAIYEKIEAQLTEENFEQVTEEVGDFVFSYGKERKEAYNKLRKWAKRFEVTIPQLETWYCVEEC